MKHNKILQIASLPLGVSLLFGAGACSDDHFDINPGNTLAGNTIWQNIEATPELDSLAMVLSRLKVYTKEEDKTRTITYKDLLNSSQTFTFWAPKNGTTNFKAYLDQLDALSSLPAAEANKKEYDLGVQFAQNHLARFNYESNGSADARTVRLMNGKVATYIAGTTFNGVQLDNDLGNIPSSNGVMHVIDGQSTYANNIYDYMATNSQFSSIYTLLTDPEIDKKTFSESSSIAGAMNENGQMVYVDSVFITDNELLDDSQASIKNEDSLYVALIPTDAAWQTAFDKVKRLYNYRSQFTTKDGTTTSATYRYNYDRDVDTRNLPSIVLSEKCTNTDREKADSLQEYNTNKALITSMYFSKSIFNEEGKNLERDDAEGIVNYVRKADSLITTNGVTFYNDEGAVFAGDYYKASNGIVFPLDTYNIDPARSFQTPSRQYIDLSSAYNIADAPNDMKSEDYDRDDINYHRGISVNLGDADVWNSEIDLSPLDTKYYRYFSCNNNFTVKIPLPNLYSGMYRIKLQVLPNRVSVDNRWIKKSGEEETEVAQETVFSATIQDDEGNSVGGRDETGGVIGSTSEKIEVDENEIKTYTLWDKVEIPKCYVGLPGSPSKCYPLLVINVLRRDQGKKPNSSDYYGLSLSKLIIEPVSE